MPTVYRSTDTDAPVLTGIAGSLIAVLDACLVNGYTGKAAAGWTKAFSGTNKAAYKNNLADGGSECLVRVVDDGTDDARVASFSAFATMSDIDTGTFETKTLYAYKSATNNSAARPWILVADGLTFHFYIPENGVGNLTETTFISAGDYECLADPENALRYCVIGSTDTSSGPNKRYASIYGPNSGSHSGISCPHLDGIKNPQDEWARQDHSIFTPSDTGFTTGNCGSSQSPPLLNGSLVFGDLRIGWGTTLFGRVRGLRKPASRLDNSQTPGEFITGTTMIYTQVAANGQTVTGNIGALPIETVGPW